MYIYNPIQKNIEKQIVHLRFPFQGHYSYKIRKELTSMLGKYWQDVSFRCIFTNNNTMNSLFNDKTRLPDSLCSNIVYKPVSVLLGVM